MKKNYVIYASVKGGTPFRSRDYNGTYTQKEAERILEKNQGRLVSYTIQPESEPAPSEKFLGPQGQHKSMEAETEIARLRKISERQSAMLAQALKEKNDLASKKEVNEAEMLLENRSHEKETIRILRLEVESLKERLRKGREAISALRNL